MTRRSGVWFAPRAVRRAMVAHARAVGPEECCGLLLGSGGRIEYAVRLANISASRRRYRIDDAEHIELRKWLRRVAPSLAIVGVYHSHPASPAEPSDTDVRRALYPEWLYVIVGGAARRAAVRGFRIRNGRARETVLRWHPSRAAGRPARES
jgi:proteasome lid subunit RPN8/RPN11